MYQSRIYQKNPCQTQILKLMQVVLAVMNDFESHGSLGVNTKERNTETTKTKQLWRFLLGGNLFLLLLLLLLLLLVVVVVVVVVFVVVVVVGGGGGGGVCGGGVCGGFCLFVCLFVCCFLKEKGFPTPQQSWFDYIQLMREENHRRPLEAKVVTA